MSADRSSVEEIRAEKIRRGDRIWAPADNDWLVVARIVNPDRYGDVAFYRDDHSEATFAPDDLVLRKIDLMANLEESLREARS
jgi:hypothetical protein